LKIPISPFNKGRREISPNPSLRKRGVIGNYKRKRIIPPSEKSSPYFPLYKFSSLFPPFIKGARGI